METCYIEVEIHWHLGYKLCLSPCPVGLHGCDRLAGIKVC